ncbi:MAG: U32 family peptidase [Deltaproteobacteria bacterium]|nr:U32 family peptidase [Deltaproteobacteria bacterium]
MFALWRRWMVLNVSQGEDAMAVELLAPAKNCDVGKVAVNCGADAVYIGAQRFGARKEAGNSILDIATLIEYAHRYMVKVYVALNTVLQSDEEVHDAVRMLRTLHDAGVDGAIIQDMGLLEAGLPPMPIIASTQTHNANASSVQFLEKVGFHRAILARELTLNEMAAIRKATSHIELEAFVHGALCVSYSGRCYLSLANGGRSANRGECAQPCRKRYRLEDAHHQTLAEGHLLSVKDMCKIHMLDALLDAGITSFKIEGRLKDTAYVANVVTAYRSALDTVLARRGATAFPDKLTARVAANLTKTFHRGYVAGFAEGAKKMANFVTPKMMGEQVGRVVAVSGNIVTLNIPRGIEIASGDGLCFVSGDALKGTGVQQADGHHLKLRDATGIRVGALLYRNRDQHFLTQLEKSRTERRVPSIISAAFCNDTLTLVATDTQQNTARVSVTEGLSSARDSEQTLKTWKKQLAKTGDSEFVIKQLQMGGAELPFMPVSQINQLRRQLLDQLRAKRHKGMMRIRDRHAMQYSPSPYPGVVDSYHNVTNSFARRFYQKCGATDVANGIDADGSGLRIKVISSRYCLRRELGWCLKADTQKKHTGGLFLVDLDTPGEQRLNLRFDCDVCEMSLFQESEHE